MIDKLKQSVKALARAIAEADSEPTAAQIYNIIDKGVDVLADAVRVIKAVWTEPTQPTVRYD